MVIEVELTELPYSELRKKAHALRGRGEYILAAQVYGEAHALQPLSNAAMFSALCYRDAGDDAEFFRRMALYNAERPLDFDGWITVAINYRRIRQFDQAEYSYRMALSLRDEISVRNALVNMFYQQGDLCKARLEGADTLLAKDNRSVDASRGDASAFHLEKRNQRNFDPENPQGNVISFSLWGANPTYVSGAIVNAQIAIHLYPRWTARFYLDDTVPADAVLMLRKHGAQIVKIDANRKISQFKNFWRFLPNDDQTVNVFICRDADSRLNVKEVNAVYSWLKTNHVAHVMRDHILHHELMLAGMWGLRCGVLDNFEQEIVSDLRLRGSHFADQSWLAEYVWPKIRSDVLVNDSQYGLLGGLGFPGDFDLPGKMHVGAGLKKMPHWSVL